jgi:hypothetical protein
MDDAELDRAVDAVRELNERVRSEVRRLLQ